MDKQSHPRKPGKWTETRPKTQEIDGDWMKKPEFQMPHAALCRLTLLTAIGMKNIAKMKKWMKIEGEVKGEQGLAALALGKFEEAHEN
jgi:hypothetical protein